jgi:hypothetical protein
MRAAQGESAERSQAGCGRRATRRAREALAGRARARRALVCRRLRLPRSGKDLGAAAIEAEAVRELLS